MIFEGYVKSVNWNSNPDIGCLALVCNCQGFRFGSTRRAMTAPEALDNTIVIRLQTITPALVAFSSAVARFFRAVSYTHLTLPTKA